MFNEYLLTISQSCSRSIRILSPLGCLRGRDISSRLWPFLPIGHLDYDRTVDRISGIIWCRRRLHGGRRKLSYTLLQYQLWREILTSLKAYIAVQNIVPAPQIPTAMSIVLFCQNMGASVALPAANAIFSNRLRSELQDRGHIIHIESDVIVDAGVRSIRGLVQGDALTATLEAYSKSIDVVMYLGIGVAIATFTFGWGLGFKDIRKVKKLRELRQSDSSDDW